MTISIQFMNSVHQTALYYAVETEKMKIIDLLLENDKVDVNIPYILLMCF